MDPRRVGVGTVHEISVGDKRERARFVAVERAVITDEPLAIPEIASDVHKRLQGRSPFFEEMEHAAFLATDGGRYVARCTAMINRRWQRDKSDTAGFIGYFAALRGAEPQVAELLTAAEQWFARRGADRVIAPFNGAAMHGLGTLTDAFDESPMFPFSWQPPHYPTLLEANGYRPNYPFWIFDIDFSSERYRATATRALTDQRCTVRPLDRKRWKPEVEILRTVFNDTFSSEWEFHRMTSAEFHEFVGQIKSVLDPQQFLIAEVDGETAGFCFGFPDWTPLFRSFDGKVGPLQIVRLLLRAKHYDRAGLISIGVRDAYRHRHIGQTLAATLYRYYEQLGLRGALYYPVNDHNIGSRRLAESFGATGRILYTAYDKPLI